MKIGFDPAKHEWNLRERGLGFDSAARIFLGDTIEWDDDRFDYGERRMQALGRIDDVVIRVVFTWRLDIDEGPYRWIISARPPSQGERRIYAAYLD